ncbi:uncharacterized protein LOC132750337 [Ruditapes philippinarum]|uniref:uncharacterized protein LOC132750337 n=1 Tax=Ruditapes philippinarum TaxID=129788 RepID=UPI00295A72C7|nr:uncharacterized protein LOC132750337 [Ruditapes philippinarum]
MLYICSSAISLSHLRSKIHRRKGKNSEAKYAPMYDDQFYDIPNDTAGVSESTSPSQFVNNGEREVFEEQLAKIQEQLVSVMIEKQNLEQELKQYKENVANEKLKAELEVEKKRNKTLQDKLKRM